MSTASEVIATERRRRSQTGIPPPLAPPLDSVASPSCVPCPSSPSPSPSPGYVLAWSEAQQHRHILSNVEELREELVPAEPSPPCPSTGRILVLRIAHVDDHVRDVLSSAAGVDPKFLDSHVEGVPYRPPRAREHRGGKGRADWRSWRYPEVAARDGQVPVYRPGEGQVLTISRMSVWLGVVPVLLVGHAAPERQHRANKGKAKAKTNVNVNVDVSRRQQGYGAMGPYTYTFPRSSSSRKMDMSSFEQELWETVVAMGAVDAIEQVLGQLVYDRWTGYLRGMRFGALHAGERESLWGAMGALETNLDEAAYLSRRTGRQQQQQQQQQMDAAACPAAWGGLMHRLEMRMRLRQGGLAGGMKDEHAAAPGPRTDNDRSLDRIAYLGGLLLPVTVVASILAIEGDYGPEGGNFWVFWVASSVASVLALLIIYADQLRTVEVWFEIGDIDEEDLPEGEGWEAAKYLVQKWTDGSKGGTWRREQLGWGGAVKKMSGYYRWRRDPRLAFGKPGEMLRPRA